MTDVTTDRPVNLRCRLYRQLDAASWPGSGLSPLNRAIAFLILLAVASAVLGTEPSIYRPYQALFDLADLIFVLLFSVEYALRLWTAGEDKRYRGIIGRLRYIITPAAVIDLLAILPFIIPAGMDDAFLLRLFRLLRLVSLAKLGRYSTALENIYTALKTRRYELIISLAVAFVVMLASAAVLHLTEGAYNPESFGSIPRAMWWGVATVSKVGYAGAFPVTVLGKVFAGVFAIAAVGVVAIPTGILAAAFGGAFEKERKRREQQ